MSVVQPQASATAAPEKYLIAFVIQGDDVFKITADNIIHTTGTANGPAFDAIAKLKAAAALLELTNRHKERPDELRQMARELAGEGMKLMARASSDIRSAEPAATPAESPAEYPGASSSTEPATIEPTEKVVATEAAPRLIPMRIESPVPVVLAAVPKPEERSSDATEQACDFPSNSKIALISG
jgi:hypothetical protein